MCWVDFTEDDIGDLLICGDLREDPRALNILRNLSKTFWKVPESGTGVPGEDVDDVISPATPIQNGTNFRRPLAPVQEA